MCIVKSVLRFLSHDTCSFLASPHDSLVCHLSILRPFEFPIRIRILATSTAHTSPTVGAPMRRRREPTLPRPPGQVVSTRLAQSRFLRPGPRTTVRWSRSTMFVTGRPYFVSRKWSRKSTLLLLTTTSLSQCIHCPEGLNRGEFFFVLILSHIANLRTPRPSHYKWHQWVVVAGLGRDIASVHCRPQGGLFSVIYLLISLCSLCVVRMTILFF